MPARAHGFDRSIDFGVRNAEQALLAERLDEAAGAVETLRLLAPANSRLAFLQSQIDKERARANQDAAQRQAFEARQVQIRASLGQMEARLAPRRTARSGPRQRAAALPRSRGRWVRATASCATHATR